MKSFCTFFIGDYYFGIETEYVIELNQNLEVTRIPLAEKRIGGYINLRGILTLAIDLGQLLGVSSKGEQTPISLSNIIIAKFRGEQNALIIDKISEILQLDEESFEDPPSNLSAQSLSLTSGCYKLDKHLLITLNLEQVLITAKST